MIYYNEKYELIGVLVKEAPFMLLQLEEDSNVFMVLSDDWTLVGEV